MRNLFNKFNPILNIMNFTNLILNLNYIIRIYLLISLMMNGKIRFKIFLFKKLLDLLKPTMNTLNMLALLAKSLSNYLLTNASNFKKFHQIGKHLISFLFLKNLHGTLHSIKFALSQL